MSTFYLLYDILHDNNLNTFTGFHMYDDNNYCPLIAI